MAALEIRGDNRPIFFGACCIPNIQFNRRVIYYYFLHFEIDGSDQSIFRGKKLSLGIPPK